MQRTDRGASEPSCPSAQHGKNYLTKLLGDPVQPTIQKTDDDDTDDITGHGRSDFDTSLHPDDSNDDGDDSSVSTVVAAAAQ